MPVVPRGARTVARVLVVGDRRRWLTRTVSPAPGSTEGRGGRPRSIAAVRLVDAIPGHRGRWASRGGNCRWSSRQPRTVDAVFARWRSGRGSASYALRDRLRVRAGGDGPGPTAAIIDSQRAPAATPCPGSSRRRWRQESERRRAAPRGEVNGCCLPSSSPPPRSSTATLHPDLAARRGQLLPPSSALADGGCPGRLLIRQSKTFSPLPCRSSNACPCDDSASGPALGWSRAFRVDQQAPPLRARTRPDHHGSHGPPRHDHDHDQATRPS